ncbi:MAG: preprotein translocase subunit SecG [Gammaproteobacteria bacterium]|nr:preprotein translocase subunit SecG [Gammaproteobacteria bacterium]MDE0284459.1 preprotein translocase subunit SecG [Gammaproteobacteria bacterium]MDE0511215.1 preprotein translocase subunit SecG [Gammaproteobacteria bacterium]
METLQALLLVVQVICAIALIGFILIQHGKGADAGAAFGSGASATVFGAAGSGNFLTKTTTALAFVFLLNSLVLAWMAKERSLEARQLNVVEPLLMEQPAEQVDAVPDEIPVDMVESDIPIIPE